MMGELRLKMHHIARQQNRAGLRQTDQQRHLAGCMAGHGQHGHAAVAIDIVVGGIGFDFRAAVQPGFDRRAVDAEGGGRITEGGKVGGPDHQNRLREAGGLTRMVEVIVADAEPADLLRFDADPAQLADQVDRQGRSQQGCRVLFGAKKADGQP